jgi:hypothetical protein
MQLLFTQEQFFDLFAAYNVALWYEESALPQTQFSVRLKSENVLPLQEQTQFLEE